MTTLQLDQVHSSLNFQIKHMMVSKAKGEFEEFDVHFSGDLNDLSDAQVTVTIPVTSINTGNEQRDGHLRSGDFFEADQYPNIEFRSTSIKKISDEDYEVTGDFTIKGETRQEIFTVEYNGTSKSPMDGSTVAGFDVSGKINREAYGLTYNAALETGGVLLGRDVKFEGNLEFVVAE